MEPEREGAPRFQSPKMLTLSVSVCFFASVDSSVDGSESLLLRPKSREGAPSFQSPKMLLTLSVSVSVCSSASVNSSVDESEPLLLRPKRIEAMEEEADSTADSSGSRSGEGHIRLVVERAGDSSRSVVQGESVALDGVGGGESRGGGPAGGMSESTGRNERLFSASVSF
jgi:hypothetical protein